MNKQINQSRRPLAIIAAIIMLSTFNSASAQTGIGKKFGARDPRTCADRTKPAGNAITAAKAKEYIECSEFFDTQNLYLYDEVNVQVGAARPYNRNEDLNVSNIDVRIPVTPIRGTLKQYQCGQVNDIKHNAGENCFVYSWQHAHGLCYKDSFKDWHCSMADASAQIISKDSAPPGGATVKNTPVDQKPDETPKAKTGGQKTDKQQEDKAEKDENGYPKPDFSVMEKWFDIVKYEYGSGTFGKTLNILAKPKTEIGDRGGGGFWVQFLDKDGALVIDEQPLNDNQLNLNPLGTNAKTDCLAPTDAKMKKVATIRVVKHKQ